ncbi:hypothetical protein L2E82_48834 [Cichorium intybus]|uniref:Uncharacterized protein n=1 Tax=Cichorium intybus TaxID=13427 RepID=A0ACB8Z0B3_CICIN|nr:hypothetical protein L2E82_48834 [Cichorium intybus]
MRNRETRVGYYTHEGLKQFTGGVHEFNLMSPLGSSARECMQGRYPMKRRREGTDGGESKGSLGRLRRSFEEDSYQIEECSLENEEQKQGGREWGSVTVIGGRSSLVLIFGDGDAIGD